jgi:predicted nucleic acid-binding protein
VRLVVLDPQFLAAAFLAPNGRCRKLLVVLAYGRLVSNVERVNAAEIDKLQEEADLLQGTTTIGGPIDQLRDRDHELRALLAERLPIETPAEFGLVTSPEVLEQVRKLLQSARQRRPSLPPDAADRAHRRLCFHTAKTHMHLGDEWTIPRYTEGRAPAQEWLIHLATQTEAEFLVTGDTRIALDPNGPTSYVHAQTRNQTQAWRLDSFIDEIQGYHFALDDVDGELPSVEA